MSEKTRSQSVTMATQIRTALRLMLLVNLSSMWAVTGTSDSSSNSNTANTTSECPVGENILSCPPGHSFRLETVSCTECFRGSYKEEYGPGTCKTCPIDDRGQKSTTFYRGATNLSHCLFRPEITDFNPKYGPVSGGTKVTIDVRHLDNRKTAYVNVAGFKPRPPKVAQTETSVVTLTQRAYSPTRGPIFVQVFDDFNEYTMQSPEDYRYLPDPSILNVTDMRTIISGGLTFVVTGEALTNVHSPRLMVNRTYLNNVTTYYSNCEHAKATIMTCKTPDLKEGLDIEAIIREHEESTVTRPNSTVTNGTRVVRQKRNTEQQPPSLSDRDDMDFSIGFEMDGVEEYRNISSLPVFLDPDFDRFEETDSLKTFFSDEEFLNIKGHRLNHGVRQSDVVVKIGVEECLVTFVASNYLTCRPPETQPKSGPEGSGPRDSPMVIVYIGDNLSFVIGFLEYRSRSLQGYPSNMPASGERFTLIISISMIFLFWVVVIWIIGACYAYKSGSTPLPTQAKKPDTTDVESVENDYRTESERYLSPVANGGVPQMHSVDEISISTGLYTNISEYAELGDTSAKALLNLLQRDQVKELCLDNKRLTLLQCIGEGNFGLVYKGMLKDETYQDEKEVAVKTLQGNEISESELSAFVEEAIILKGFSHRNIVQLFGIVINNIKPHVILEYMDRSDLRSHVSNKTLSMTKADLLGFGLQVAEGMTYLSGEGFIHRDLAARNCMINSSTEVKIADFGLSRDLYQQDYYKMREMQDKPMPIKWMAVESLNSAKFSVKSDVWSFGVLLWELLTRGVTPYPDVDNYDVRAYVNEGRRLDRPAGTPDDVWLLLMSCWFDSPGERPTFQELTQRLTDTLEYDFQQLDTNDYLDVF